MKVLVCSVASSLLLASFAWSQQANVNLDHDPQKNRENLIPFSAPLNSPDVHDDRTVTFRLKAPLAKEVRLVGVAILTALGQPGGGVPFTKGEDGIWTLTVGPLRPDIYAYHFDVDGVQIADPSNTYAAFTAMPPYSQLVVHGDGPAYYDARNVPHGTVTRHVYHSDVTRGERELYVYTPPGYDRTSTYPVLYLVGGSGELPSNWIYDGRANFILDNLLAEGKAVPMVMVIPNNQVVHRNHPKHVELTFELFEAELRQHVLPLVEREYSVRRDPKGRALSGLSMGGRHTMFVGFNSLDLFASFGVLSAGDVDAETSLDRVPEHARRQWEDRLPLRRPGHGGDRGPHGGARHRSRPCPQGPRHQATSTTSAGTAATTGPPGATCCTHASCPTSGASARRTPAPVMTESGLVQGVAEKDLTVYRGIPFAAPPTGDLRWRTPQPAARWKDVRSADKFGPGSLSGRRQGERRRGLPLPQRLDAGPSPQATAFRCWSGSTAAASPSAPPPLPSTTASTSRARVCVGYEVRERQVAETRRIAGPRPGRDDGNVRRGAVAGGGAGSSVRVDLHGEGPRGSEDPAPRRALRPGGRASRPGAVS